MIYHLVADSADRKTICGIRTTEKRAMPYVLAVHLQAHQEGHGPFEVCSKCQPDEQ